MSKAPKFGISGFTVGRSAAATARSAALPPPPNSAFSKQGYSTLNSINHNAIVPNWGAPKKRTKTEEEYFEEEDETSSCLEYIPAPGSPSYDNFAHKGGSDSDEEDPLDAYMADIEKQVEIEVKGAVDMGKAVVGEVGESSSAGGKSIDVRYDIEQEDDEESYYRYMEENPTAGLQDDDSDLEIEYDEDGNPLAPKKNKYIDPLPPIDHSSITYENFDKNFYVIHDEIAKLTNDQVKSLREALGIKVTGPDPPHPVSSFAHFGFDDALMKAIRKSEYVQPTPIQAQAVPAALSGRDIIGIAKTGSGKTVAFIWPMLVHIMDQKQLEPGDGPIGLILAPTRELSQQIYTEAKRFGRVYNINVICCYGGGSKWEQSKALEAGAEIVVATPGRMIDLVKMKATNLSRVTFLVLDEADRMFNMGFEPQVRSICSHVRPERQTLLFSATFKKKVEKLAREALTDPIRIVQGDIGEANADVSQMVYVMQQSAKLPWLLQNFVYFLSVGSVLVFVTRKLHAEELAQSLSVKEYEVLLLHGDMDQTERNDVISKFKKQEVNILIATDVAARGLDIPHIRTVINYDVARDIDTHTHRIGRTGRAGEKGTAYTLVTKEDKEFACHLVRNLESVTQDVPQPLLDLAMQCAWFRKSRFKTGKGKSAANVGGAGLGYRERSGRSANQQSTPAPTISVDAVVQSSIRAGPGSERLSALKAAFKSQYQTQFTASEDHTWEQTRSNYGIQFADPTTTATTTDTNSNATEKVDCMRTPTTTGTDDNVIMPPPPPVKAAPVSEKRIKKSRWDTGA